MKSSRLVIALLLVAGCNDPGVQQPVPIDSKANEKERVKPLRKGPDFSSFFLHVPLQDKVIFARHLAVGIKSGMTLQAALKMIQEQTRSRSFKKILTSSVSRSTNVSPRPCVSSLSMNPMNQMPIPNCMTMTPGLILLAMTALRRTV